MPTLFAKYRLSSSLPAIKCVLLTSFVFVPLPCHFVVFVFSASIRSDNRGIASLRIVKSQNSFFLPAARPMEKYNEGRSSRQRASSLFDASPDVRRIDSGLSTALYNHRQVEGNVLPQVRAHEQSRRAFAPSSSLEAQKREFCSF